ncbi:hypothetical protein HBI81_108760 [Parastagonospora nodorum]|nr:hypothetical protein HBH43_080210 [Parastagonospora nodorum]KAH4264448.1 hypothetical protein HBI03_087170 [Parastagonospora nodorum]KAH4278763.1 hypothetical protein HBI04_085200 [Parastagonospora nodorum]KAH4302139.1 hypothetical protein HBI02_141810 [Parastagonospora nodorum]KAH4305611.1 hypothetical protein HBI01_066720 [Parastagonospora nodorum]
MSIFLTWKYPRQPTCGEPEPSNCGQLNTIIDTGGYQKRYHPREDQSYKCDGPGTTHPPRAQEGGLEVPETEEDARMVAAEVVVMEELDEVEVTLESNIEKPVALWGRSYNCPYLLPAN